jgi:hypothetical protein
VAIGAARVGFSDAKQGISVSRDVLYTAPITDSAVPVDWAQSVALDVPVKDLRKEPEAGASYETLPAAASQPKNFAAWEKAFARWLADNERVELLRHAESKMTSQPGEAERDFRIRVQDSRRAARDEELDEVRKTYAPKQAALAERLRKAEATVEREQEQSTQQKLQTALSFGATVLGAFMGRKAVSASTLGRATTAARGLGRSMKEASDVTRASESADAVRQLIQQLEDQMKAATQAISARYDAEPRFDTVALAPARGQVAVQFVAVGWDPRAVA